MLRNLRSSTKGREQIRSLNRQAVLEAIHRHGQISRIDLATELDLSPAALTDITSQFISHGLVFEARSSPSTSVGRKPILLEINYNTAFVIGVKVSNSKVTTALTNLGANVLGWCSSPVETIDPDTIIKRIKQNIKKLLKETKLDYSQLVGLGIGLPGIVDADTGHYRYSALFGWRDVPFKILLEENLELPVLVENDVNALAVAEAWFGSGQGHPHFLVVTLGRGVGLGIIINSQIYRGPHGGAGEFGHVTLEPGGALCSCGKQGCIEAYLSDEALLHQAQQHIPDLHHLDELVSLAKAKHIQALDIYQQAGKRLGQALSKLVNIFAPSLIVLSGEGMRAAEFLLPIAIEQLKAESFGDLANNLEIKVDTWGDEAWARGAAGLAASRYLYESAAQTGGETPITIPYRLKSNTYSKGVKHV